MQWTSYIYRLLVHKHSLVLLALWQATNDVQLNMNVVENIKLSTELKTKYVISLVTTMYNTSF